MDAVQRIIAQINKNLAGLGTSQKVALLLGAVLVAGSLTWMVQWAAKPAMIALWDGNLTAEEIATISGGLDTIGETYEIRGNGIFVRASANPRALIARLQQMDMMPSDISTGFASLVKESNPWISQAENDRRWTHALQRELEAVLRQFADVSSARVFLNLNAQRHGFSRSLPPSSASVTLFMKGGQPLTQKLAKSAARLIAGAVRGLSFQNVSVVDGSGNTVLDWEDDRIGSTKLQQERAVYEREIREKIRNQLAFDPRSLVNVRVELDFSTETVESHKLDDPVDVSEISETEQRSRAKAVAGGQPGVQPNVGVEVDRGAGNEQYTKETARSQKQTGYTHRTVSTPSGQTFAIFAAVNISHSYLQSIFKRFNPDAAEPTLEEIETIFEKERVRIVEQISKLVRAQDDQNVTEQIAVSWYFDPVEEDSADATSAMAMPLEMAGRYGPQAGLAVLALIALRMMTKMAKKPTNAENFGLEVGLSPEAIKAATAAKADLRGAAPQQKRKGKSVGRAAEDDEGVMPMSSATEGVLIAQEVDESMVQIQKMLEEVDQMVKEDPESITTLFEQWIDRGERVGA
ncbi:MAG: flagellar M-ring protein FliF C-terminal domain-containing protein [Phycisphaerae bacterium]